MLGGPWRCWAAPGSAGQSMVPLGSPWYRWAAWIPTALQHGLVTGAIAALLICLLSQKAFQCAYFFSNIRDGFQCHVPMRTGDRDRESDTPSWKGWECRRNGHNTSRYMGK